MIFTERLHIRRFRADDLDGLYALLSDPVVMEKLEAPYSQEMTEAFLARCGLAEHPLIYAVDDRSGAMVGYVIYHPYDREAYEIGWVLHRAQWGKGYAGELTRGLIADARKRTRHLIIECLPAQLATRRIAQAHHFAYVGHREGLDVYRLDLENGGKEKP